MKLNFASCTFTHSIKAMSCVAALFLGLLGVAPSSSATVLTATDSSWKVTASSPGASGWNSNAAFDDSGWASATVWGLLAWLLYAAAQKRKPVQGALSRVGWAVEGSPAYPPCNVDVGLRELNPTYPNTPAG